MSIITDNKKISELLSRGVEEIIDRADLTKKLKSGKQLRVKLGIDPTSPHIHLGRSIPLFKLRDFQELGHQIVFIIGDFTAVIGDTSDKESERPMLDDEIVKSNMKDYIEEAGKIIDVAKCELHYNSKWLGSLNYKEIAKQANIFSVNEFASRENIKKRLDRGKRVSLREFLYPLMQGYDSVVTRADVEVGGTDQRFNLLAGRALQKFYGQEPQNIITNPLIEGLDGRKMSASWHNTVNLADSPRDMYGKIMSLKDEFILKYFLLATRVSLKEVESYRKDLENGVNPMGIKEKLAYEFVRFYYSDAQAQKEEKYFRDTFRNKRIPSGAVKFKPSRYDIMTILVESRLVVSKSEAMRALKQRGVRVDKSTIDDPNFLVQPGSVVQKGKISFVEII